MCDVASLGRGVKGEQRDQGRPLPPLSPGLAAARCREDLPGGSQSHGEHEPEGDGEHGRASRGRETGSDLVFTGSPWLQLEGNRLQG